MKRIHFYFSPVRDWDLINLMMNPQVDFNKLAKSAIVNYVKGKMIFIDPPAKINYEIEENKKYECTISLKNDEEFIFDFLQRIDEGLRSTCIKQIIRFSINGGLINYFFDTSMAPILESKKDISIRQIAKRSEADTKLEQKAQSAHDTKGQVVPGTASQEPKKIEPVMPPPDTDFDLFGELAAMGAGPH